MSCIVVLLATGSTALAAFPGDNGRIAFWGAFPRCNPHKNSIATIKADGTGRRIVFSRCGDRFDAINAEWSADGRRLAFLTDPGLCVMRADGTHARTLGPIQANGVWMSFGPDGRHVVYSLSRDGGAQIWRAGLHGQNAERVGDAAGREPRWSPDGRLIAFVANDGVRVVDAQDGTALHHFSDTTESAVMSVDWSPDSSRLLWASEVSGTSLSVAAIDGSQPPRVITKLRRDREVNAAWAPNGRRIALAVSRRSDESIAPFSVWTIGADGTDRRRVYRGHYRTHFGFLPSVSWGSRPR